MRNELAVLSPDLHGVVYLHESNITNLLAFDNASRFTACSDSPPRQIPWTKFRNLSDGMFFQPKRFFFRSYVAHICGDAGSISLRGIFRSSQGHEDGPPVGTHISIRPSGNSTDQPGQQRA